MKDYFEWLGTKGSQLCVGLDPTPDQLNLSFLTRIIEATAEYAGVFKPNYAFFEQGGIPGLELLVQTIEIAHANNTPVILDGKRGDIGNTAAAYARAAFEIWNADAVTVSPYLGSDSVQPWVRQGKGIYVLCHTTNPGSIDLQHLKVGGRSLYLAVAELVDRWKMLGTGLVVGATFPEAIGEVRRLAPSLPFLIPGVGAQGGDLQKSVAAALRPDGSGFLINASRSIVGAACPADAAKHMFQEILAYREASLAAPLLVYDPHEELVLSLYNSGCIKFGDFVLKSGLHSPIYVDLRMLVSFPEVLWQVARAYTVLLTDLQFTRVAAIPFAALPIGTTVSLLSGKPLIYPREQKQYGTKQQIEGEWKPGDIAVVLDDLITTGKSKFEAIEPLISAGITVCDVVVLIDREQGGRTDLAAA